MTKSTKSSVDLCSMSPDNVSLFAPVVLEKLGFGVVIIDSVTHRIAYANAKILYITGYSSEKVIGKTCHSLLCPTELGECPISDLGQDVDNSEREIICSDGSKTSIIKTVVSAEFEGREYLIESVIDNTERKIIQDNLEREIVKRKEIQGKYEYLAYHDYLTGIYNRRFFKEEFTRKRTKNNFPLGIILGDINGLKVCNDTFGHTEGDNRLKEVTNKIMQFIDNKDAFARMGGDEFAILVSNTSEANLKRYMDYIGEKVNQNNDSRKSSSVSFGYGLQRMEKDDIDDLLQEAEHFMYRRKYYDNQSARGSTVKVIMQTLFEKSKREKEHSERVGLICGAIAPKMKLDRQVVNRIKIAGFLHDIGKIGIDEEILNKKGKLNEKEREIIETHTAKSARILENTVEFRDLTKIVLSHHERYDGKGYPYGLKGEEIPFEARIIAVADAYDAMTQDRTYRKTISKELVIQNLDKNSGTQFDPNIVSIFIKSVLTDKSFEGI